ncbi:hypothetical protein C7212DRAFT_318618 [Tuber magnatum]|uniref:Uncharacterized protein n=1 Tax=Tuber magnatum TaxID=42249 RepID=A0A317SPB5_9PEZI|nr:hypothetical protein C7212DRAFT_318618 [Tuber magnatum]
MVDTAHLPSTALSELDVSNYLVPELWLILFTYLIQHSASWRSAIDSFQNCGRSCSLTWGEIIANLWPAECCPRQVNRINHDSETGKLLTNGSLCALAGK